MIVMPKKVSRAHKIIVILGPTASGKSELAVKVAQKFNGEIISADSRQIYKGLDVGSGKVPRDLILRKSDFLNIKEVRLPYIYKGIKHHLIDVASPKKIFTVAQYQKLARKALKDILRRGKIPIICGGTGLYIDALIYNYQFPEAPPQLNLRKKLEKKSTKELFKQLKKLDPRRAENIDKNNRRRLIRALEICISTNRPAPSFNFWRSDLQNINRQFGEIGSPNIKILKIGVSVPKEKLKTRINRRVDKMLKLGLINETKQLLKKYPADLPAFNTIGYREIIDYLKGKTTLPEAISLIKKNTYQYTKRQMTWFKRNENIIWIDNPQKVFAICRDWLCL